MVSRAIVILNGRKPSRAAAAARHLLESLDIRAALEITWHADNGRATAERALAQGVEVVVVAGGDRTLQSVLEPVIAQRAVLAVVPLGRTNRFARALGIRHIKDALLTLEEGVDVALDLGSSPLRALGEGFSTTAVRSSVQPNALVTRVPVAYAREHALLRVEARARNGGRPLLRLYSAASSAAWDE